jgi:hypothetical protein
MLSKMRGIILEGPRWRLALLPGPGQSERVPRCHKPLAGVFTRKCTWMHQKTGTALAGVLVARNADCLPATREMENGFLVGRDRAVPQVCGPLTEE